MRTLILTFFLSISMIIYSQERKTVTKEGKFQTEIYTINKANKKKDGFYIKLVNNTTDTLIIGNYCNDTKVGLWEFRASSNKPYFCYDYDKKVIDKLPKEIGEIDSFFIKIGTAYHLTKVDRAPIYLGYKSEIRQILWQNSMVSFDIAQEGITGTSLASFVVNTTGKISEIKIEKSLTKELDERIIKAVTMINGDWLTAMVNGAPIDSKIYILYNVTKDKITTKFAEKPYQLVHNLVYHYGRPPSSKF
jgi:hypothetical protein